jgi:excisionase family DNA binding protein
VTGPEECKRRFLTIEQVAEELNVGQTLVRALVRSGELRGIQIGGRGIWRVATVHRVGGHAAVHLAARSQQLQGLHHNRVGVVLEEAAGSGTGVGEAEAVGTERTTDVEDFVSKAYETTSARIAAGEIPDEDPEAS